VKAPSAALYAFKMWLERAALYCVQNVAGAALFVEVESRMHMYVLTRTGFYPNVHRREDGSATFMIKIEQLQQHFECA
jgi:hypothetical protein